ncbi:hypothetical protein JE024_36190 [Streptomyces zhihengii]|uniref:Uncharacterized protein n=1 Tax=Streptomyces zhihengii TaxID=1818004 RepID=A0ABS2V2F6_9ACTN|nr:hypothetical protein [Streptomyces zhihengii]
MSLYEWNGAAEHPGVRPRTCGQVHRRQARGEDVLDGNAVIQLVGDQVDELGALQLAAQLLEHLLVQGRLDGCVVLLHPAADRHPVRLSVRLGVASEALIATRP